MLLLYVNLDYDGILDIKDVIFLNINTKLIITSRKKKDLT